MSLSAIPAETAYQYPEDPASITQLWYRGGHSDWLSALSHYEDLIIDMELEQRMASLDWHEVQQMDGEDFYNFLHDQYYVWRHSAPNRLSTVRGYLRKHRRGGDLSELEAIKDRLFSADRTDVAVMLKIAEQIRGMGTAGASGLLSFLFPDQFGVLDQFVVISLRKIDGLPEHDALQKMPAMGMRTNDGVLVENILRSKALALNKQFHTDFWTPRKIDMVLWSYDR